MNRRAFLAAIGVAAPVVAAPHRVYSFLWDNPLVRVPKTFRYTLDSGSLDDFVGVDVGEDFMSYLVAQVEKHMNAMTRLHVLDCGVLTRERYDVLLEASLDFGAPETPKPPP